VDGKAVPWRSPDEAPPGRAARTTRRAGVELGAGGLLARLGALTLTVDSVAVDRLEQIVDDGSVRRTAVLRVSGLAEEGAGEDVTFQPDDLLVDPPPLDWRSITRLADLWELLEEADLFDRAPRYDVVRSYRRWAIEAATLDLALRQAGLRLADVLGMELQPLRFVVSPAAGCAHAVHGASLKLDAPHLEPGLPVEIIDFKAAGDEELVARALALYPDALLEDPPIVPPVGSVSWDIPIRSARDLGSVERIAAVNVKPARVGSLRAVLALYEACATRGIPAYGGGQFELGPGRGQAQLLAALFHPDAPNDLAPSRYYAGRPGSLEPLPASPLTIVGDVGFRCADPRGAR